MTTKAAAALRASRPGVINLWQRGVPVLGSRIWTPQFTLLVLLVAIGTVLGVARLVSGRLGPFSAMNDAYAWGVWKTFNVMALTALGSGGMAIGIAAWVFGKKSLHAAMRVALVTSLLFYATGLLGLLTDVGRPWNFWNMILPWRWNTHSPLWEVSLAMPLYAFVFLLFENSPLVVERLWFKGSPSTRAWILKWRPRMRALYPFAIAGAYVVPIMHQWSLGALMLLAGDKVHPLWQTPLLPFLYLVQAGICGIAAVVVILMTSCLYWRRPLDMKVLGDLGRLLAWLALFWFAVRFIDLGFRGRLPLALGLGTAALSFWAETLLVLVPALLLLGADRQRTPRTLYRCAALIALGGLLYRFLPTTITYDPGSTFRYFPSVPEVLITAGLVAMTVAAWTLAVKLFAVLPAPLEDWYAMVEHERWQAPGERRDEHGNPTDD